MPQNTPPLLVTIFAFANMEVLDFAGPYEVFTVAAELSQPRAFDVRTVVAERGEVTGRGGFTVVPDHAFADCPRPGILVLPGGAGTRPLLRDAATVEWVRQTAGASDHVLSVCTGALLLAAAGLLEGRPATTHHGAFGELARLSLSTEVRRDARFVRSDDTVWTSGGISAGIDLALAVVAELAGEELRQAVVEEMEWGW